MKHLLLTTLAIAAGLSLLATAARAQDACQQLWYERNAIFKQHGYCFKTSRAIRTFGNAGCQYDDERELPMSQNQRNRVAFLVRQEREYGCR